MSYPSDLNEQQWSILAPLLDSARKSKRGRPLKLGLRQVINGILYVTRTGCQWRQVPQHEYGHWMSLYSQFWRLRERGVWDGVLTALREQARTWAGRAAQPSVAIIDSQSVQTALKGGNAASTPARKSKGVSAISPSTRKALS
jgi:putative transposase